MNVFELFASLSLKADGFFSGLSSAGQALSSFGGAVNTYIIEPAKKIDGVLVGISNKVVSTTATFVSETVSIAKAIDENVMSVVDRAGETVIGAFQAMATEGVAFFKDAMQEGMSFDTAMGQVGATLLQTRDDMDATTVSAEGFNGTLREFAKKMGAETMFTATQAAEALNYMALAGYDAQTSAEMLPKVLNLAAAGAMDLGYASDVVTDVQTAFGLEIERTGQLIDEMAKASTLGNTSVSGLGEAFLTVGGLAKELGGGFTYLSDGTKVETDNVQELATAFTVMASAGVKGSEAGTHMRNLITKLISPTENGAEIMNELGIAIFDTEGKMRSISGIFTDLDNVLSQMSQSDKLQVISELFNTRDISTAEALLQAVSTNWHEVAGQIVEDSEGAAEEMAKIQRETLPGQIEILRSAFSILQTEIYEKVAPMTKEFVEMLSSGLSNVAAEITEGNWGAAFTRLGSTAAKLIEKGVNTILENGSTINDFIDGIVIFVDKVGTALFEGGSKLLPQLLGHLLYFAQQIITNFSDFLSKEENIKTIEDTVSHLFSQLETFFDKNHDNLYNIFSTLFDLGIQFIDDLFVLKRETVYSILYTKFTEILSDLAENLGTYLSDEKVTETVDNVLSFIGEVAQTLLDSSSVILPELLDFVLDIGDKVITGLVDFLSDEENLEKIRGTINLLLIKIQTFLDEHEDDLYTIFDTIYDVGIGFLKQIFTIKRKTTADILWRKIQEIFQPVGDAIWNFIDKWILNFGDSYESLFQPVGDAIWKWIELQKKRLNKWVDKEFKEPFGKIKNFFSTWWDTIVTFWSDKKTAISEWFDESKELITTAFENIDLSEIGKNIIEGLWNGIGNAKDWLIEKIGGFTDSVTNAFKDFFGIQSPSKVMRDEVGKFLAEGVGVGFTKEMDKVTEDMQRALPTTFDINTDIVSKSSPTQSIGGIGSNVVEVHIQNFYNNTQEDMQNLGRVLYNEIFRDKVAKA